MEKIIIFDRDLYNDSGDLIFEAGIEYELRDDLVFNGHGAVVDIKNIWVNYLVKVKEVAIH